MNEEMKEAPPSSSRPSPTTCVILFCCAFRVSVPRFVVTFHDDVGPLYIQAKKS